MCGLPSGLSSKKSACQCRKVVKNQPANAGDSVNPWVMKNLGEGNGNPLKSYCLGNPKDRGSWWTTVHGVSESDTT